MRAVVKNKRIVFEGEVDLPEGLVLDLVVDDEGDDLTDAEREALHAAMERAWESSRSGNAKDASEVLARLRSRRAD